MDKQTTVTSPGGERGRRASVPKLTVTLTKMSSLQQKIQCRSKTDYDSYKGEKKKLPLREPHVGYNKDSKVATRNIVTELKETGLKEVKAGVIQCLTKQRL